MQAKSEIRYAMEPVEVSGPVRVLMREGKWLERPENYERYERPVDIVTQPKRDIRPDPMCKRKGPRKKGKL